jgi:hypothetical protein
MEVEYEFSKLPSTIFIHHSRFVQLPRIGHGSAVSAETYEQTNPKKSLLQSKSQLLHRFVSLLYGERARELLDGRFIVAFCENETKLQFSFYRLTWFHERSNEFCFPNVSSRNNIQYKTILISKH